ncbi:hypothetical protein FH972_024773 [Carpinus fangiana]|uniref:Uncharacterized protein n=1 Tax=Carpinus fangiana TaxID=176857 RepID=A0A5N6KZF1_9ROSI|nr:hypothetical protein FH972_024773 [Carpinus fangiana]
MEGLYSERSIKEVILVTEELSDCSMTESKRFCFTLSAWKAADTSSRLIEEKQLKAKS